MKYSLIIGSQNADNPIEKVLAAVAKTGGHSVVSPEEADIVVATSPRDCLKWLKAGKQVRQFLIPRSSEAATGLVDAYPGRFTIVKVLDSNEFLSELAGKKVGS